MAECVHMLHLVPVWQSEERHRKLKIMMQDRPDLIQSELAGLAFDSLQQVFRKADESNAAEPHRLAPPRSKKKIHAASRKTRGLSKERDDQR